MRKVLTVFVLSRLCFPKSINFDEHFGEGGVDVYGLAELLEGGTEGDVGGGFLDEVGCMGSVGMTTEQTSFAGLTAKLHHALCLAHGERLAIGTVEGFMALEGHGSLFQLVLGWPYAGCFRCREYGCRHDIETDVVLDAKDVVHDVKTLVLCGMG